ncbi:hypothetical protein KKG71_05360 [Patescibacteria group bacterium]|nr:hypothetical protein [Patescibacteria group bacterium]
MAAERDSRQEDQDIQDQEQAEAQPVVAPQAPVLAPVEPEAPVKAPKRGGVIRRAAGALTRAPGKAGQYLNEKKEKGENSILDWTNRIEQGLDKGLMWVLPDAIKELVNMGNVSLADAHKLLPRRLQILPILYKFIRSPFKFLTRGAGTLALGGWRGAMLPRHVLNLLGDTVETAKKVAIELPASSDDPIKNWSEMMSATGDYAKRLGMAPVNLSKTLANDFKRALKYTGRGVKGSIFNVGRLIKWKSGEGIWKQIKEAKKAAKAAKKAARKSEKNLEQGSSSNPSQLNEIMEKMHGTPANYSSGDADFDALADNNEELDNLRS